MTLSVMRFYAANFENSFRETSKFVPLDCVSDIEIFFFQEFFSQRNDASLLVFGSHSKKRPNNIVFGKLR